MRRPQSRATGTSHPGNRRNSASSDARTVDAAVAGKKLFSRTSHAIPHLTRLTIPETSEPSKLQLRHPLRRTWLHWYSCKAKSNACFRMCPTWMVLDTAVISCVRLCMPGGFARAFHLTEQWQSFPRSLNLSSLLAHAPSPSASWHRTNTVNLWRHVVHRFSTAA